MPAAQWPSFLSRLAQELSVPAALVSDFTALWAHPSTNDEDTWIATSVVYAVDAPRAPWRVQLCKTATVWTRRQATTGATDVVVVAVQVCQFVRVFFWPYVVCFEVC